MEPANNFPDNEQSQLAVMDTDVLIDLKPQSSSAFDEFTHSLEKYESPTFFEKQQNELMLVYRSDPTMLQISLANNTSFLAAKHQVMQDLIASSKKSSIKQFMSSRTGLDFRQEFPAQGGFLARLTRVFRNPDRTLADFNLEGFEPF